MPVSSRSDSAKAEKLEENNFTTFDHAAAGQFVTPPRPRSNHVMSRTGHADLLRPWFSDGVRCSVSGSVVAKPCQQQEVDFYESSVFHPEFAKYMPVFIGTLTAAEDAVASLNAASAQSPTTSQKPPSTEAPATTAHSPSTDTIPLPPESGEPIGQISLPQPLTTQDAAWVPSGGRKLETDISIVLENVASGFKRPNVIDVKLGSRLWADDAVPDKRARLDKVSRETTSASLGFRIAGMKVWGGEEEAKRQAEQALRENDATTSTETAKNGSESSEVKVVEVDGYKRYDKWYGRSFGQHDVKKAFETFLDGAKSGETDHSTQVAMRMAAELRSIESVLKAEESRMYSSSILYVYEGDPEAFEEASAEEAREKERVGIETDEAKAKEKAKDESDSESGDAVHVSVLGDGELNLGKEPELGVGAEAATLEELEDEEEEEPCKVDDIRLIDFAHASWTPGQGCDENALHGIGNLARIMEEIAGIDS